VHGAPASTGRTASKSWSTSTTPTPSRSCWYKTTPNTHTPASLYEAFAPAEARRLADRLELHYTPKHGSWLNMAEIELAVLSEQCLDRRLADRATLQREVAAWQAARNACGRGVDWRFTTEDARIKLKHLYPAIQD
jgi:DDE superfamily endonuclease